MAFDDMDELVEYRPWYLLTIDDFKLYLCSVDDGVPAPWWGSTPACQY